MIGLEDRTRSLSSSIFPDTMIMHRILFQSIQFLAPPKFVEVFRPNRNGTLSRHTESFYSFAVNFTVNYLIDWRILSEPVEILFCLHCYFSGWYIDVYVWQVEGTFRVRKPPVLLGYTYDSRSTQADMTTESTAQHSSENTYVTLFVTIEPQLAAPEPFREKVHTARCILINH